MTAILRKNGLLLADSFVEKGGEWLEMADKVMIVKRENQLVSKDGKFEDHILGMAYAGARYPAMALCNALHFATVKMLEDIIKEAQKGVVAFKDDDATAFTYETVKEHYKQALSLGLINTENHFVAILIGAKHDYAVELCDKEGLSIEKLEDDRVHMLGSGSAYMADFDKRHNMKAEPIRMMHHAMLMEPSCGGQISQYQVLDDKNHISGKSLVLTGLYHAPDPLLLQVSEVAACQKLSPDLAMHPLSYFRRRRNGESGGIAIDDEPNMEQLRQQELKEVMEKQNQRVLKAAERRQSPKATKKTPAKKSRSNRALLKDFIKGSSENIETQKSEPRKNPRVPPAPVRMKRTTPTTKRKST